MLAFYSLFASYGNSAPARFSSCLLPPAVSTMPRRGGRLILGLGPLAGKLLRVLRSEHGIWESDTEVTHKVLVYTEAVPEDEGARWWCRAGETA